MTKEPGEFGIPELGQLYINGIRVSDLAEDSSTKFIRQSVDNNERFWATQPRLPRDNYNEILIIRFTGPKLINYINFEHAAFPQTIRVMALNMDEKWRTTTVSEELFYEALRDTRGRQITKTYRGSIPYVVNTALASSAGVHPHHFGQGHWIFEEYDLRPTETEAIAIWLERYSGTNIQAPVNESGEPVPYSLGIRNLDVGYRIRNKDDIPYTNRDPQIVTEYETFTQVTDIAGSMVELKMRENRAEDLLQQRIWKSEPQPVSYSVVNLYVDSRDELGNSQVIDRFFIDPLTSGPNLNLYYSNEEPDFDDFAASDSPLSYPLASGAGPGLITTDQDGIRFPDEVGYLDISNKRLQWNPSRPFWVGMHIQPFWESGTDQRHVLLDMDVFRLEYYQGRFQLVTPQGILSLEAVEYVDNNNEPPEDEDENEGLTSPAEDEFVSSTETFETYDTLSLVFGFDGENAFLYSGTSGLVMAAATTPNSTNPPTLRFGSTIGDSPDPYIPTGNFRLKSFVLKSEKLDWMITNDPPETVPWEAPDTSVDPVEPPLPTPIDGSAPPTIPVDPGEGEELPEIDPGDVAEETTDGIPNESVNLVPVHSGSTEELYVTVPDTVLNYLEDPIIYNRKSPFIAVSDDRTRKSLLRMLPEFITSGGEATLNPYGFLGGPVNYYDKIKWTPIARDYKLRRGEMQFYPTKAKFFKFEFTDLTPQPYDVHTPVTRKTKIFASEINKAKEVLRRPSGSSTQEPGLAAQAGLSDYFLFADAVRFAAHSVTGQNVSPTEVMYAKTLAEKERLDQFGSMYQFHPWHPSAVAPRNQEYKEHYYETVSVEMKQRIAYFVGLSQLLMYRQDYHEEDNTPEYVETFQDLSFIDDASLLDRMVPGYVNAISNPGFESDDILKSWDVVTIGTTDNPTLERVHTIAGIGSSAFADHFARVHSTNTSDFGSFVGIRQEITRDVVPEIFPTDGDGYVSLSFYSRNPGYNGHIIVSIVSKDSLGAEIDSYDQPFEFASTETTWTRRKVVAEITDTTESLEITVYTMSNPSGSDYRADMHFDGFLLEQGDVIHDYIDGTYENAMWIGGETVENEEGEPVYVSGPDVPSRLLDRVVQPWEWNEEYVKTPASLVSPVVVESDIFKSRRNVRGVQFATTQSAARQLLNDSYFKDDNLQFWEAIGDADALEKKLLDGNSLDHVVTVRRYPGARIYGEMHLVYSNWGEIESSTWADLEGDDNNSSVGGIRYNGYVLTSQEGRIYAAARVYTNAPLSSPLSLQIIDRNNSVLAEKTVIPNARGVTEWWVPFNIGDTGEFENRTWGDIELMDIDPGLPTYADLELGQYRDLASVKFQEARELSVQIVQQGPSQDTFYVDNISLFEDAIRWQFSNDGGITWHDAYGIRNNPTGVLIFPPVANPIETPQNKLKWRAIGYRPNLYIGNLTIRPWYGGLIHGVQHRNYGVSFGPNATPADQLDIVDQDPFFANYLGPLPQDWFFNFRQLLLQDREYVPIEVKYKPKGFGNTYAGHLDPEMPPPSSGLVDIYPGTYSFIYGVQESPNNYVNFYDPENKY